MLLTRHEAPQGTARWALDGRWLPADLGLDLLLRLPRDRMAEMLRDDVSLLDMTESTRPWGIGAAKTAWQFVMTGRGRPLISAAPSTMSL